MSGSGGNQMPAEQENGQADEEDRRMKQRKQNGGKGMQENIKSVFSEGMETIQEIGIYGGGPKCPQCGEEMHLSVTWFPRDPIYYSAYYSCPGCKNWMTRPNCGPSVKRCVEHAYLVANRPRESGTKDKPSIEGVSWTMVEVTPQGDERTRLENSEQCISRGKQDKDHGLPLPGSKRDGQDMSRREENCDIHHDIPEDLAEDTPHLSGENQRRAEREEVLAVLEAIVPLYLTSLTRDEHERQNAPQPGRKGDDPDMNRQEDDCNGDRGIPIDRAEKCFVMTDEIQRKLREIRVNSELELVGWLFLMGMNWDVPPKQETQEGNLNGREKGGMDAKPLTKN